MLFFSSYSTAILLFRKFISFTTLPAKLASAGSFNRTTLRLEFFLIENYLAARESFSLPLRERKLFLGIARHSRANLRNDKRGAIAQWTAPLL